MHIAYTLHIQCILYMHGALIFIPVFFKDVDDATIERVSLESKIENLQETLQLERQAHAVVRLIYIPYNELMSDKSDIHNAHWR